MKRLGSISVPRGYDESASITAPSRDQFDFIAVLGCWFFFFFQLNITERCSQGLGATSKKRVWLNLLDL